MIDWLAMRKRNTAREQAVHIWLNLHAASQGLPCISRLIASRRLGFNIDAIPSKASGLTMPTRHVCQRRRTSPPIGERLGPIPAINHS